jgi:hypothetical protein
MERKFNFRYVLAIPESGTQLSAGVAASKVILPERRTVSESAVAPNEDPPSVWPGDNIAVIPWAADIRWENPAATNVTMTRTAWTTERHPDGFRVRDLTISGEIDLLPYADARVVAMIGEMNQKGIPLSDLSEQNRTILPPAYRAIVAAIELCERVAADRSLELHLYSFDEGRYYIVEPRGTVQVRSLRNRLGWHYEFRFTALAKVVPPKLDPIPKALPKAASKNWYDKTLESINAATAGVQTAIDEMKTRVKFAETQVNKAISTAETIAETLTDAARLVVSLKNAPMRVYTHLKSVENRFKGLVTTLTGSMLEVNRRAVGESGAGARLAVTSDYDRESARGARWAMAYMRAAEDAFYIGLSAAKIGALRSMTLAKRTRILPRDSLESIALREFNDSAKWKILADLNGLRYPYISRAGGEGIMRPGEELILPATTAGSTGTFADPSVEMDERLFGRGIALTADGDWKVAADQQGVDTVVGTNCVTQGLRVRFGTEQGKNPCAPTMGLPQVIGEESNEATTRAYSVAALWQANRDDRVRSIREFELTKNGNVLGFDAVAELVTSQDLTTGTGTGG